MGTVTDFRPMDKPAHPLKTIVFTPLAIGLMDTPPLHPEPEFHPVTKNDGLARIGQLDADRPPQHASAVLPQFDRPMDSQLAVLDTQDALERLADRIGSWRRLATLVRNLAFIHGDDLERPADRCLADGAALINNICVQCGRDNS